MGDLGGSRHGAGLGVHQGGFMLPFVPAIWHLQFLTPWMMAWPSLQPLTRPFPVIATHAHWRLVCWDSPTCILHSPVFSVPCKQPLGFNKGCQPGKSGCAG